MSSAYQQAVESTRESMLASYRAFPRRLDSDANHAATIASDYGGRWLLEALQNAEDAHASKVWAMVFDSFLAIADNGAGFPTAAVQSVSLPHVSPKTGASIGRKGLGFRAVYEVTDRPIIATLDGSANPFCFGFDSDLARQAILDVPELAAHQGPIPYQYLPFGLEAPDLIAQIPAEIRQEARTLLLLPFRPGMTRASAWEHLTTLQGPTLLALKDLAWFEATNGKRSFHISWLRDEKSTLVTDSREKGVVNDWVVRREVASPPDELLLGVSDVERQHLAQVEVLAAWQKVGRSPNAPVHVYFPTEDPGPCGLFLHADFLLQSNRKRLLAFQESKLNAWLGGQLMRCAIALINECVASAWSAERVDEARRAVLSLTPIQAPTGTTKDLVDALQGAAKKLLRLPGNGNQTLEGGALRTLETQARHSVALAAAMTTNLSPTLVASPLLDAKVAEVLKALGVAPVRDSDLRAAMIDAPATPDVGWARWNYLVSWAANSPRTMSEVWKEVGGVPVLPFKGWYAKLSDAENFTLSVADADDALPTWLGIFFVDAEWIALRKVDPEQDRGSQLLKAAGIFLERNEAIRSGLTAAINAFWEKPDDKGTQFVTFLLQWGRQAEPFLKTLAECPVRTTSAETPWARANATYFGTAWGNDALEQLCGNTLAYAAAPKETEAIRPVLESLGVSDCPRIVYWKGRNSERQRAANAAGVYISQVDDSEASKLDGVDLANLEAASSKLLLKILGRKWDSYYSQHIRTSVSYRKGNWTRHTNMEATWVLDLRTHLRLGMAHGLPRRPLDECFIVTESLPAEIAAFLPCLDTAELDADSNKALLRLGVRTRADEIQDGDMRRVYVDTLPTLTTNLSAKQADKAYQYLLEWADGKQSSWIGPDLQIVADSKAALVNIQADHVWLLDHSSREGFEDLPHLALTEKLRARAKDRLGLQSLKQRLRVRFVPGENVPKAATGLTKSLDGAWRYILAWLYDKEYDVAKAASLLASLQVEVLRPLTMEGSVDGATWRSITQDFVWVPETSKLLVSHSESAAAMQASLARGLVEVLDVAPSSAAFIRALLGHDDDDHRRRELLEQDVPLTALDLGRTEPVEISPVPAAAEPVTPPRQEAGPLHPPADPREDTESEPVIPEPGHEDLQPSDDGVAETTEIASPDGNGDRQSSGGVPELRLKSVAKASADLEVRRELPGPPPRRETDGNPGGGGGGYPPSDDSSERLTRAQRLEIERIGRGVVKTHLERNGYAVEEMAQDHPGFDLRARNSSGQVRIEVKAHVRHTFVADVSARQILEMGTAEEGDQWELWNVCNLGEDQPAVVIHVVSTIPVDVLEATSYRVDLRKCSPRLVA